MPIMFNSQKSIIFAQKLKSTTKLQQFFNINKLNLKIMEKKLFQVVVKWTYTNKICIYNFTDFELFSICIEDARKNGILITTNIAKDY